MPRRPHVVREPALRGLRPGRGSGHVAAPRHGAREVDDVGGPGAREPPAPRRRALAASLPPHGTGTAAGRTRPRVPAARAVAPLARGLRRLRAPHPGEGDAGRRGPRRTHAALHRRPRDRMRHPGVGRAHRERTRVRLGRHGEPEVGQRALRAARARDRDGDARYRELPLLGIRVARPLPRPAPPDDARRVGRSRDPGLRLPRERSRLGLLPLLQAGRAHHARGRLRLRRRDLRARTRLDRTPAARAPPRGRDAARRTPVVGRPARAAARMRPRALDVDATEPRGRPGPRGPRPHVRPQPRPLRVGRRDRLLLQRALRTPERAGTRSPPRAGVVTRPAGRAAEEPAWQPQLKEQTQPLDRIREGLEGWMRRRLGDPGLTIGDLRTPGGTGVANETVLFAVKRSPGAGAGPTEGYVARLATPDSLSLDYGLSVHHRMYETMMAFPSVPTPDVLGYEADAGVVGAPFFVMQKVEGVVPADRPSWATEGFIVDAEPGERRALWERTVRMLAELHRLEREPFLFLRTGATESGVGDCLDHWMRALRWARPEEPLPLVQECEEWLLAHQPPVTALSWGDSRLPNVIYRDFTPVALLDWDLVSLAGPQADLAWWMIMEPEESRRLAGIGTHHELLDLWEDATGQRATDLRWYFAFGAYRLAAIFARLFSMMVARGQMTAEAARAELRRGNHVRLISGLLDLAPPPGVAPLVPDVRLDR